MSGRRWRPGRQTPRVKRGKVQKKHRWDFYVRDYTGSVDPEQLPIITESASRGYRHVVSEDALRRFVTLIPDWHAHSIGLRCLVLGDGDDDCHGWHDDGVVCIHAWPTGQECYLVTEEYEEHRDIFERLMVPAEVESKEEVRCRFTQKTAAGFLLMHVFLHELGHHLDRMQTKRKAHSPRGEPYAEKFANDLAAEMWPSYFRMFGL